MFNISKVREGLKGLVGFFNFYDPAYKNVTPDLLVSSSGIYVQNAHPLCSLENISNCAPEFNRFEFPSFNSEVSYYPINTVVIFNGLYYQAKYDIVNPAADVPGNSDASGWVKVDLFSRWINNIYNAAASEMIFDIIRYKKVEAESKTVVENLKLFDGVGSLNERIIKRGRFVGFLIRVSSQQGLQVVIDSIGLQIDTNINLPIYLYHSSLAEPLNILQLSTTKAPSFGWNNVTDLVLRANDSNFDSNGVFYIGYFEDDLIGQAQAIQRTSTWLKEPCISCSDFNYQSYKTWSKYVYLNAFSIPASYATNGMNIAENTSRITFDSTTNWGLNLSLSVNCDLTDTIIKNKNNYADALGMKVALKLLNEIAMTTRMNVIADTTRALAANELSVKDPDSLLNKYKTEVQSLSLDLTNMSSDCMACKKTKRIKWGAA